MGMGVNWELIRSGHWAALGVKCTFSRSWNEKSNLLEMERAPGGDWRSVGTEWRLEFSEHRVAIGVQWAPGGD